MGLTQDDDSAHQDNVNNAQVEKLPHVAHFKYVQENTYIYISFISRTFINTITQQ